MPVLKYPGFCIDASFEIIVQLLNAGFKLSNAGPNPSKMLVPAPNAIPVQTGISLALTKCQPYNLCFKKILALWLGMTAFGDYRFGPRACLAAREWPGARAGLRAGEWAGARASRLHWLRRLDRRPA